MKVPLDDFLASTCSVLDVKDGSCDFFVWKTRAQKPCSQDRFTTDLFCLQT